MNPRKKKRIEELLRRELSTIVLYELKDPRAGFLTVTGVSLSEDQRSAKVKVLIRGTEEQKRETLGTLRRARGYIQGLIASRLDLRFTPLLAFLEDTEIIKAMRLERLIEQARLEDREFRETP